jgi:hypothetical protein
VGIINQALYFGHYLDNILLNPNQFRVKSIQVEEALKHLTEREPSHSITFPEEWISIPLSMHGCLSYFTVHTQTQHSVGYCLTLLATIKNVEWNLYSEVCLLLEQAYYTSFCIPLTKRAMNLKSSQEHEIIDSIR